MSASNPFSPATITSSSQNFSSPENIRSIFFTNLLLLGIQEYSSQSREHQSSLPDPSPDLSKSRNTPQIPSGTASQSRQYVLIDSHSYGIKSAKPLELHKYVFAKGHQSTKALEFVLWFLFSRLDKVHARERFKDCWPILDRHDAREFRNVAFKWLDELRKEGCFGIGHNIHPSHGQITGLGVFLPTIRRSYLDESIGERIEQLVMILSTHVLSRALVCESAQPGREDEKVILDFIGAVPETAAEEEAAISMIDSHIVRKSRSFMQDMGQQRAIRQSWSSISSEMTEKLRRLNKELAKIESERQTLLVYQPQLLERTNQLTLSELRVLEDRWIEKINAQWQPILSFVERRAGRKEVLQSLLDSDSGKGVSVLDGQTMHMDPPVTLGYLTENVGTKHSNSVIWYQHPRENSRVDLNNVLKVWKHSLQSLEVGEFNKAPSQEVAFQYKESLELLSENHNQQLSKLQELKRRLGSRLKESNRRVERLQSQGGDLLSSAYSTFGKKEHQDALSASKLISAALNPAPVNSTFSDARLRAARSHVRKSAQQDRRRDLGLHMDSRETFKFKISADILQVRAPVIVAAQPTGPQPLPCGLSEPVVRTQPTSSKPAFINTPDPAHKSPEPKLPLNKSVIQPPPSILARVTKKSLSQSTNSFKSHKQIEALQRPSVKPVPADLVVRDGLRDSNVKDSYDDECNEIISSLTTDTSAPMTPPKKGVSIYAPSTDASYILRKSGMSSSTREPPTSISIEPASENGRSKFLASIFRGGEPSKRPSALKQNPQVIAKQMDSEKAHEHHYKTSPAIVDARANIPPTLGPTKLSFQERLGISRKRRQSSESLREFEPNHQTTAESEIIQQKELFNIFNVDSNEVPRTPSKRRKVDLFCQQLSSQDSPFRFDIDVSAKGDDIHQSSMSGLPPLTKFPDLAPKKIISSSSSKLTLEDLRAPTPKPSRTKTVDTKTTLPIMFLHTPQRKQLFPMESSPISKPFSSTSPSTFDTRSGGLFTSPKLSLERTPFSPSIFTRFKTGADLSLSNGKLSQTDDPSVLTVDRQPAGETSLFTDSLPPKMDAKHQKNSLIRSRPSAPLTISPNGYLLSGNYDVQDPAHSEENKYPDTTAPVESQLKSRSGMANNENSSIFVNRPSQKNNKDTNENSKSVIKESSAVSSSVIGSNASRNPWGRPPSWKPRSPKMVDMEKRLQLDRTHRSVAGDTKPTASSLDGPLKVSVYGRPSVSVPSSLSPSFSSSTISSRSFQSDLGLAASRSHWVARGEDILQHDNLGKREMREDDKHNDESDEDTRGFSPPPVSPIRKLHPSSLQSLSESTMSIGPRLETAANQPQLKTPTNSLWQRVPTTSTAAVEVASAGPSKRTPVSVDSTGHLLSTASMKEPDKIVDRKQRQQQKQHQLKQLQEEARERFLEDAIQDEELVRSHEEDETILNHALQQIFDNKEASAGGSSSRNGEDQPDLKSFVRYGENRKEEGDISGGLFDEMMPEALDLNEALWENTELFS
ncbi:hypothetical protein BGZ80_001420 [Entomortierella chlamydospora]|uniref:HAUS augmin-like complex subunit 6 N-terminal domain-containing protein n=1 Tax=Entomortierella chlamydospora TaxID=101097 RepID=A0A9P6N321_9FUNG|nr:hypothetical protein BGZ80_001420 [Entomortierella chlamydospora]